MTDSPAGKPKSRLGTLRAVLLGQLMVNVPTLVIILLAYYIARQTAASFWVFMIGGFLVAWGYNAFVNGRWQRWALRNVADRDQLIRVATMTGLMRPSAITDIYNRVDPPMEDSEDEEEEDR
jgi:hypothetical protein